MAVNTTTTAVSYDGDGVSVLFTVPFVFFGSDELEVIEQTVASGAETTKSLGGHYSVAGGNGATGSVTAIVPPAVGLRWFIRRKTKRTQLIVYDPNDAFPAKTHERGLDRGMAVVQEIDEQLSRALRFPKTDAVASSGVLPAAAARADKWLGFDGAGNLIAAAPGSLALGPGDVTGDKIAAGAVDATKLATDVDTQRPTRMARIFAATNLN